MLEAADAAQTNDGERDSAGDEDEGLNGVGVDDRGQATGNGVDAGGDHENHSGFPERPASDTLEDHAGGIELHGNFGEDVGDDGNSRQIDGGLAGEAAVEEIRHRGENCAEDRKDKTPP